MVTIVLVLRALRIVAWTSASVLRSTEAVASSIRIRGGFLSSTAAGGSQTYNQLIALPPPEPGYQLVYEQESPAIAALRQELQGMRVMALQQRASESGLDACIRRSGGSRSSYVAGCSLFVNLIFVAVIVSLASSSGYSPSSSEDGSSAGSESPPEELVTTTLGAVAADEPRCSAVGASVLDDGGGAVDAAVATA